MSILARVRRSRTFPVVVGLVGLVSILTIFGVASTEMYGVETPANLLAYWHMALAWTGGVAFLVTFLASVQFLRQRERFWNLLAGSSGEIGLLMLTATIAMGSLWGSEIWGVYWSWGDVRLVTILIAWFIYAGYLIVFHATLDGEGQFGATYAIVGFVTIPLSYISTRIWQAQLHSPTLNGSVEGTGIDVVTLLVAIAAVALLYIYLLALRVGVLEVRDDVIRTAREASR